VERGFSGYLRMMARHDGRMCVRESVRWRRSLVGGRTFEELEVATTGAEQVPQKSCPLDFSALRWRRWRGPRPLCQSQRCALEAMRACGAAGRCQAGSAVLLLLHTPGSYCNLLRLPTAWTSFPCRNIKRTRSYPHGDSDPPSVLHLKPSRTRTMRRAA
jgi:hypothetical protein